MDAHTNEFWYWSEAATADSTRVRLEIELPVGTPVVLLHRYDSAYRRIAKKTDTTLGSATLKSMNLAPFGLRDAEVRLPPSLLTVQRVEDTTYFDAVGEDRKTRIVTACIQPR